MATFRWSALSDGDTITGGSFNPATDRLRIDDSGISAGAMIIVGDDESLTPFVSFSFGGGTVTVEMNPSSATTANVTFDDGSMLLVGDNTTGTAGDDAANTLVGGSGHDQFIGLSGADSMVGGGGNDVFTMFPSNGNPDTTADDPTWGDDTIRGGTGTDGIIFPFSADGGSDGVNGVNVNLATGIATGGDGPPGSTLTLFSIENVDGSAFADVITGSSAANVLRGGAGNDTLSGGGENDTLVGGSGNDTLNGGAGNDMLIGGWGNDVLIHQAADTSVQGGGGTDTLRIDGSGVVLNLTLIANTVHTGIEKIHLTGSGDNTLTLARSDVLAISSTTDTLRIDGNVGDTVNAGSGWTDIGVSGAYHEYRKSGAILLVDDDITQNIFP